jgi:hypothetical protein
MAESGHDWLKTKNYSADAVRDFLKRKFNSSRGIADPSFHPVTKEKGIAILEGAIQQLFADTFINKTYLQKDDLDSKKRMFLLSLTKRADLATLGAFDVTISVVKLPTGKNVLAVCDYEGMLLVSRARPETTEDEVIAHRIRIGDLVRRPGAEWDF